VTARVLVVEDDPTLAFLLVDSLQFDGFEVRQARDGIEALDVLNDWVPHVMLMDLGLPRMDGWELRRHQLELPEPQCSIPVVVLSGAHISANISELKAAVVMRKPFDIEELAKKIRVIVGERDASAAR